jgi:hypothetical protein
MLIVGAIFIRAHASRVVLGDLLVVWITRQRQSENWGNRPFWLAKCLLRLVVIGSSLPYFIAHGSMLIAGTIFIIGKH